MILPYRRHAPFVTHQRFAVLAARLLTFSLLFRFAQSGCSAAFFGVDETTEVRMISLEALAKSHPMEG